MPFFDLPTNPQTSDDHDQWRDWINSASPAELLDALLARRHPGKQSADIDLEPTERRIVEKLRAHLEPRPDLQPQESEPLNAI